jgi:hypothetical protein
MRRRRSYDLGRVQGSVQAFDDWMKSGSLLWTLVLLGLLTPVVIFVHELGHALLGLAGSEGLVEMRVGRAPPQWYRRFGRLRVSISLIPARNTPAGFANVHAQQSRAWRAAFILAGPFAQAAVGVGIVAIGGVAHVATLTTVGVLIVSLAVVNLAPFNYRGFRSDGAQLIDLLRNPRPGPIRTLDGSSVAPVLELLQQTQARWLALYSDERLLRNSRGLGNILSGAPGAMGLTRDDPRAVAISRLAFAGWCWREAERRGDLTPLLAGLRRAWDDATAASPGDVLVTPLAASAAVDNMELGLASPGATDRERRGFLAGAFSMLPPRLRPQELTHAEQWFAFRFGVAVHDVEAAVPDARARRESLAGKA